MAETNILNDFYLPIKSREEVYNSTAFKTLRNNNIDTAELEGFESEAGAGLVEFNADEKFQPRLNDGFVKDALQFFFYDLPKDTLWSVMRGAANTVQKGVNLGVWLGDMIGLDKNEQRYEVFNNAVETFKTQLDQSEGDSPFVSKLLSVAAQDAAYVFPLYKKFTSMGLPRSYALPLSFGIGSTLAFDKKDYLFVDSAAIKGLKEYMNIEPNTPSSDMYDYGVGLIGNTALGGVMDKVIDAYKFVKKIPANETGLNVPGAMIATEGGTISGVAVDKLNQPTSNTVPNTPAINTAPVDPGVIVNTDPMPNQDMGTEKKNLDFNQQLEDQTSKLNLPPDNMLAMNPGPIFRSIVREMANKIPKKGTGQQILNTIKNTPGVKEAELKWTGLDDFLKDKKSVTKQEIQEYLQINTLDVAEVKFGGKAAKFSDDLENTINNFESKYVARDPEAAYPNYDVYTFKTKTYASGGSVNDLGEPTQAQLRALSSKTGIDEQVNQVDFASIIRFPFKELIKNTDDISKYLNANGKVEMTTVEKVGTSGVSMTPKNIQVLPTKEAEALVKSDSKNKLISTFEIDQLELEKAFVENKKREFRMMNAKAPKFEQYTSPGGSDYTELVFKIKQGGMDKGIPTELTETSIVPRSGGESFKNTQVSKTFTPYKNPSHMNVKSEIAHVRFKTREQDGMKILTVEEMQSDFGIAASKGMANKPDIKITDFPFKNTWYELVTKRLIRHAADNGFDAVAIPKGIVSAKRYGQDIYQIANVKITAQKYPKGTSYLDPKTQMTVVNNDKDTVFFNVKFLDGKLNSRMGSYVDENEILSIAKKYKFPEKKVQTIQDIISGKKEIIDKTNTGLGFNSSFEFSTMPVPPVTGGTGKGKAELYDKAIPSFMKKYGKKWNAKVYDGEFDLRPELYQHGTIYPKMPVTILEITPEMKQSVQQDGQALFNLFGIAGGSAAGAKAVSDNMKNNTISKPTNN